MFISKKFEHVFGQSSFDRNFRRLRTSGGDKKVDDEDFGMEKSQQPSPVFGGSTMSSKIFQDKKFEISKAISNDILH